jgi:hypothetical protein
VSELLTIGEVARRSEVAGRAQRLRLPGEADLEERMTTGGGPTIAATLRDGPLAGRTVEAEVVEGRPPKTIDLPLDGGEGMCRYGLAEWMQSGASAAYSFLYRV